MIRQRRVTRNSSASVILKLCDHKSSTGKLYGDVIDIFGAVRVFHMIEAAFVGELGTGLQSG